MSQAAQGGVIRLTAQFYEFVGGPALDPSQPITLDILYNNISVLDSIITYNPGDIQRESTGFFSYTWDVPTNATIGVYVARWSAVIHGADASADENFEVVAPGTIEPDTGPSQTLGNTDPILLGGILDPMFLDPDEILPFFDDANYFQVAELIHTFSEEVRTGLNLGLYDAPSYVGIEYIKAATLCSLSRIYPFSIYGVENGFGNPVTTIRLGDFETMVASAKNNSGKYDRGNASNWCEYAEVLRREMLFTRVGMKAVVKGSNYRNPIPVRAIREINSRSVIRDRDVLTDPNTPNQGQLDGAAL